MEERFSGGGRVDRGTFFLYNLNTESKGVAVVLFSFSISSQLCSLDSIVLVSVHFSAHILVKVNLTCLIWASKFLVCRLYYVQWPTFFPA